MPQNEKISNIKNFNQKLDKFFNDLDGLGKEILSYISLYSSIINSFDNKINQFFI